MILESFLFGLVIAAIGLAILRWQLRSAATRLRAVEQAFEFHRLRDNLQDLRLNAEVDGAAPAYGVMMWMCNVAIRNAGTIRIRDVPNIIRDFDKSPFAAVIAKGLDSEWESMPAKQRDLAKRLGMAFLKVMVLNDLVLTLWYSAYVAAMHSGREIRERVARWVGHLIAATFPSRKAAVELVTTYYSRYC